MDGIDAAIVDVESHKLVQGITRPYSPFLQNQLKAATTALTLSLAEFCQINRLIGEEFAAAVLELLEQAKIPAASIKGIGSHGQTLAHDTAAEIPYTLQLGCGHTIAQRTGIPVVADFRTRDLILGGQGAPFAPLYHQVIFADKREPIALVNIGGISNISLLTPGHKTQGWDLGPGNCLMDAWIYKEQGKNYDKEGSWASQGKVNITLLEALKKDPFFKQKTPKSLGKEYYSLAWLESYPLKDSSPADVQATLLALTAWCIAEAVNPEIRELFICGGGVHNTALMHAIQAALPEVKVQATDAAGISSDYLEAMLFAWLASQTLQQKPIDLRDITGSHAPVLLGAIYPVI